MLTVDAPEQTKELTVIELLEREFRVLGCTTRVTHIPKTSSYRVNCLNRSTGYIDKSAFVTVISEKPFKYNSR